MRVILEESSAVARVHGMVTVSDSDGLIGIRPDGLHLR